MGTLAARSVKIYKLPWFLVIGEEAAGKTSLINRSDQKFSLTTTAKVSWKTDGIRRRRDAVDIPFDIEWWMSDDAILIDPDGGLLTQKETQKVQEGELAGRLWEHFIEWLYKTRTCRPLNGLVLVLDLPRLINQIPSTTVCRHIAPAIWKKNNNNGQSSSTVPASSDDPPTLQIG